MSLRCRMLPNPAQQPTRPERRAAERQVGLSESLLMTPLQALAFVRKHGVVLEAARGPVPSLVDAIAGEPVRGSWWSHPCSHEIFELTRAVRDSEEVLVCRLVQGKITYVHCRLWPALVRAAKRFPRKHLAQVHEVHTSTGRHLTKTVAFPKWVPAEVAGDAAHLGEPEAVSALRACLPSL